MSGRGAAQPRAEPTTYRRNRTTSCSSVQRPAQPRPRAGLHTRGRAWMSFRNGAPAMRRFLVASQANVAPRRFCWSTGVVLTKAHDCEHYLGPEQPSLNSNDLCPGWDSNPHCTQFECALSAVGVPGLCAQDPSPSEGRIRDRGTLFARTISPCGDCIRHWISSYFLGLVANRYRCATPPELSAAAAMIRFRWQEAVDTALRLFGRGRQ
jgi:hypothetical protein